MAGFNVQISELRTRITFQQPSITKDAGGAQSEVFTNVSTDPTVWARWTNAYGQENTLSDAMKSVQRANVVVRYRSDIQATWQVLKDGQAWKIVSPPENVRDENRWSTFLVEYVKGTS